MEPIIEELPACNQCKWQKTRAHRSGIFDNILSMIDLYPYRCDICKRRFYSWTNGRGKKKTSGTLRVALVFSIALLVCLAAIYLLIQERVPAGE